MVNIYDSIVHDTLHTALDTLQTVTRAQRDGKCKREMVRRIKVAREVIDKLYS
jgi:hypothetical protein